MLKHLFHKIENAYYEKADFLEEKAFELGRSCGFSRDALAAVLQDVALNEDEKKEYEEKALQYNEFLKQAEALRQDGKMRQRRFNVAFWMIIMISVVEFSNLLPINLVIDLGAVWMLVKYL